jgi:hypothetical protein
MVSLNEIVLSNKCHLIATHVHEGEWQWSVGVLHVVGHHQGDGGRDAQVGQEDEEEGSVDGDGNRKLRILSFLSTVGCKSNDKYNKIDKTCPNKILNKVTLLINVS